MADIRVYRADSMQDALNQVRNDLGSEAIILTTRQVPIRTLLPWKKKRFETEITAALGSKSPRPQQQQQAVSQAISQTGIEESALSSDSDEINDGVVFEPSAAASPKKRLSKSNRSGQKQSLSPSRLPSTATPAKPAESPMVQSPLVEQNVEQKPPQPVSQIAYGKVAGTTSKATSGTVGNQLDSIQQMMAHLNQFVQADSQIKIAAELYPVFNQLVQAEVDSDIARQCIAELNRRCSAEQILDPRHQLPLLGGMIEQRLDCGNAIQVRPGRRKVIGLVGPTGVGKTTTIAKLASNFRLKDNLKMGLVTVDTYRIAAVEQLRTYAEIMSMPMKVVTNPLEMTRALDELSDLDLVFIDTAGRSPQVESQVLELQSLLPPDLVDEIHLVLSTVSSVKSLTSAAKKFATVPLSSIILTKLDEAPALGSVLSLQSEVGLPISYLTTGQAVPDDMEPAEAGRLSRLILQQETIHQ